MSDVVEEHRQLRRFVLCAGDLNALKAQVVKHPAHQVHRAERVLKAGVDRAGIDEIC